MLEVEMKFPGADFAALERQLVDWGAVADQPLEEADLYLNAPDRDFGVTDEALRLRRIGPACLITYKGPKQGTTGKTRLEVEAPLAPGEEAAEKCRQIFVHLGYRPVTVVRKVRRIYHLRRHDFALEICLDEVDDLGQFAELEIQAPPEQLEAARQVLLDTAAALGLGREERRSYLQLLLAAREEKGSPS